MQAEVPQPNTTRRCSTAAVFSAMETETVQMLVTPGKQDLQKRMQVRKGHLTPDTYPAPDERANASEDDPQLVDAERCGRDCHALRVVQRSVLLKSFPRYLALSNMRRKAAIAEIGHGRSTPNTHECSDLQVA